MTDDLERDLRTMLAERAGDVRTVPTRVVASDAAADSAPGADAAPGPDADVLELGTRGVDVLRAAGRRWPLLVAAAAVAAILAVVLTTLPPGPARHGGTPALHTTAPVPTVQRTSCTVTDPSSWNADVLSNSFVPSGVEAADGVGIQAVLRNGDEVIDYIRGGYPRHSIGSELGVLTPGSRSPRDLGYFGVPEHGNGTSFSVDVEADASSDTVAVAVEGGTHNRGPLLKQLYALNVDTGHRTLLTTQSRYPHGQVQVGYVQNGTVYFEVDARRSSATDIYAVPISGGTPRRVGGEPGVALQQSALGVTWNENGPIERPADVPAVVARHGAVDVADTFGSYVTDGTAYAWATRAGALQWYSPEAGHVVSFPGLLAGSSGLSPNTYVNAVAGPLVYYQGRDGNSQWLLDTRSGARVRITSGGTMMGSAGGVAVGDPLLAGGRQAKSGQLMRLGTRDLVRLHC